MVRGVWAHGSEGRSVCRMWGHAQKAAASNPSLQIAAH